MNKVAYTAFVAFISSVLTLVAVYVFSPGPGTTVEMRDGLRQISMAELALHDSEDNCWKAINGYVYDVTEYIPNHPTPAFVMTRWCGQDATEGWVEKGRGRGAHSPAAEVMLKDYLIGVLVEN